MRRPKTIDGISVHRSITTSRIMEASERHITSLDNPGFCLSCGIEQDGCEPDMEGGSCEACGAHSVYGADGLLLRLF